MSLPRDYRFLVPSEDAFPSGVIALGDVEPATERQSQEDRARGREPRQRVDEETRLPVWQVTVSDPSPLRRNDATVVVEILSAAKPELPAEVPGVSVPLRQIRFTGLSVQPRLGGQGEFRFLTYAYRADGVAAVNPGGKTQGSVNPGSGGGKSAGSSGGGGR